MHDASLDNFKNNPQWKVDRALLTSFDAPIYRANIQHLGMLGVSLAADFITVMSPADGKPANVELSVTVSHQQIAAFYEHYVLTKWQWMQDLYHVAQRIKAAQDGTDDLGTLAQTKSLRRVHWMGLQKAGVTPVDNVQNLSHFQV